jgi:hypothetical protein
MLHLVDGEGTGNRRQMLVCIKQFQDKIAEEQGKTVTLSLTEDVQK